jgi:hypothetical protein
LVLSRKNKKKQKAKLRMESPRKVESVRRSRRTAPSVYRSKGGQENHVTSKRKKTAYIVIMLKGLFWNCRGLRKKVWHPI